MLNSSLLRVLFLQCNYNSNNERQNAVIILNTCNNDLGAVQVAATTHYE